MRQTATDNVLSSLLAANEHAGNTLERLEALSARLFSDPVDISAKTGEAPSLSGMIPRIDQQLDRLHYQLNRLAVVSQRLIDLG